MKTGKEIRVKTDKLGKPIYLTENSMVLFNNEGYSITYFDKTVEVIIGIGNDNTASLIMSEDAWNDLKAGEKVHISEV
jgi:hypothetical protein